LNHADDRALPEPRRRAEYRRPHPGRAHHPFRELVIALGAAGYFALFEIANAQEVVIAAVQHQREDAYDCRGDPPPHNATPHSPRGSCQT
jgi:hypothetical protein